MRAIIFLASPDADIQYLNGFVKEDDYIICADSGYKYAKRLGCRIDAVMGDFDSCSIDDVDFKDAVIYPCEKDFTDCEIAMDYAIEKGADEIVLVCAKGGRSDHFLANILLKTLLKLKEKREIFYQLYLLVTQKTIQRLILNIPLKTKAFLIPVSAMFLLMNG